MFNHRFKTTKDSVPSINMTNTVSTDGKISIKGEVFWKIHNGDDVISSGHKCNVVTLDASILIARLLKGTNSENTSEPRFGIYALAVGTGDAGWNVQSPPSATNTQRSLFNEISRKKIETTRFITQNGAVSNVPTNVVDFTTTFVDSEAAGALTEMGLIGGDISTYMNVTNPVLNSTQYDSTVNTVGKDTLVNYITFPVINKPPTSSFTLSWRLTF